MGVVGRRKGKGERREFIINRILWMFVLSSITFPLLSISPLLTSPISPSPSPYPPPPPLLPLHFFPSPSPPLPSRMSLLIPQRSEADGLHGRQTDRQIGR